MMIITVIIKISLIVIIVNNVENQSSPTKCPGILYATQR